MFRRRGNRAFAIFVLIGVILLFDFSLGIFFAAFSLARNNFINDRYHFLCFSLAKRKDLAAGEWCGIDIHAFDDVHDDIQVAGVGDENELVGAFVSGDAGIAFKVTFKWT